MSELGLELEERDGGIFVKEVQEFGSVAAHGEGKKLLARV